MKKLILIIGVLLFMASCAPRISTSITRQFPPLDPQEEVFVFGMQDPQPGNAEMLGVVRIGSPMTSISCDLPTVLSRIMAEARKVGGNVLNITEHVPNSSGCHQITATILRVDHPEDFLIPTISENANYALLHLYRPPGPGSRISYDLYLDSIIVGRSSNNWRTTLRIEKEGQYTLTGRTQQTALLPLNIRFGEEFYVRSSVTQGFFVGRPALTLVDNQFGRIEFQAVTTPTSFFTVSDTANELTSFAFPRFRFAVNAGFGYRTASFPEDMYRPLRNFYQRMRLGFQLDAGATYFFSEWLGFGLNYNIFFASNEEDNWSWVPPDGGSTMHGRMGMQDRITFFGPTFSTRLFDRQKRNCWIIDFGLGWLGHQHRVTMNSSEQYRVNANTLGVYLNFSYDIWLSATTSLGIQLTMMAGSYSQFTVTRNGVEESVSLERGQSEDISRIGLSIGLRF